MDINIVREYLLQKPHVEEETPFKKPVPVFKIGGKMFALINIHESKPSINLKYYKERIHELRDMFEDIKPGYHMNKDNWNTVYLNSDLEDKFIKELIDVSYTLVFNGLPAKIKKGLSE